MFPIRLHLNARANRDELIAALTAEGIGTSVHYRPLHEMTYWKERYHCERSEFPVASRYFEGAVTLPLFARMTDAEVDRVANAVHAILG
jgi:dTDP-4-amino-4,6-dideoxygalactose transaminase